MRLAAIITSDREVEGDLSASEPLRGPLINRAVGAQYETSLAAATPASALAAVGSRFDLDKLVTVVVGDAAALTSALAGF